MADVLNLEQAIDGATEAVARLAQEAKVLYGEAVRKGEGLTEADLPDRLRRRLMPEGMEWPRFEGGEPVRIGDRYTDHDGVTCEVYSVMLDGGGGFEVYGSDGAADFYGRGERVRRPTAARAEGPSGQDGWERWSKDVELFGRYYAGTDPDDNDRERDALVRRAKALAKEVGADA